MPMTGIFFVPTNNPESSPAQEIVSRINEKYEAVPSAPWTLFHRLFRETPVGKSNQSAPPANGKAEKPRQSFLQTLALSSHAPRTYVAITAAPNSSQQRPQVTSSSVTTMDSVPGEPATVIAIPAGASSEEFVQLISNKFGPLWQPRHTSQVTHGVTFEAGNFRIRVGDIKQGLGANNQLPRGAVCELEMLEPPDAIEPIEQDVGRILIRSFWQSLDVKNAREVLEVAGSQEGEAGIRQWFEILRFRNQ